MHSCCSNSKTQCLSYEFLELKLRTQLLSSWDIKTGDWGKSKNNSSSSMQASYSIFFWVRAATTRDTSLIAGVVTLHYGTKFPNYVACMAFLAYSFIFKLPKSIFLLTKELYVAHAHHFWCCSYIHWVIAQLVGWDSHNHHKHM